MEDRPGLVLSHRVKYFLAITTSSRRAYSLRARPGHFFAHTIRIHVRGIEEIDPQLERSLEKWPALSPRQAPMSAILGCRSSSPPGKFEIPSIRFFPASHIPSLSSESPLFPLFNSLNKSHIMDLLIQKICVYLCPSMADFNSSIVFIPKSTACRRVPGSNANCAPAASKSCGNGTVPPSDSPFR